MSVQRFLLLKSDIERELRQLDKLAAECSQALGELVGVPSALELRGVASILHDFYCGVERIFERIATELDGELPHGQDWHVQLLERMTAPVESVRPQVIGSDMATTLREYLRFRHLFRNVYGFELRWERLRVLAKDAGSVLDRFKGEMRAFEEILVDFYEGCR